MKPLAMVDCTYALAYTAKSSDFIEIFYKMRKLFREQVDPDEHLRLGELPSTIAVGNLSDGRSVRLSVCRSHYFRPVSDWRMP